ncbi:MAG: sigma-70 family RNA polymerase sigma factor [Ruminococcaceae bacterium]|nr:sigma-70 family RNA polymerase sigma factor [Oscillospiraceae bacterium]
MIKQEKSTRDEMICQNLPLVHSCARRFLQKGIEYDDLYQAGCMGLIKAVDGFDTTRGLRFSTYAVPVILGEIRRLFRDGGSVKVSRSLKERGMRLQKERQAFYTVQGREPTVTELAERLALTPEEVVEAMGASLPPISLTAEDDERDGETLDIPVAGVEDAIVDRLALEKVLGELPPHDRSLIILRYLKQQTQQQTAEALGMTQVQVSRRERALLLIMREKMTG